MVLLKVVIFSMVSEPIPDIGEGEIISRTIYLSLDPYMRGRMNEGKSYATQLEIGETVCGGTVSQVLKSNNPEFVKDDYILTYDGWQEYAVSDGKNARKTGSNSSTNINCDRCARHARNDSLHGATGNRSTAKW